MKVELTNDELGIINEVDVNWHGSGPSRPCLALEIKTAKLSAQA
jgi:hypothetical protein